MSITFKVCYNEIGLKNLFASALKFRFKLWNLTTFSYLVFGSVLSWYIEI